MIRAWKLLNAKHEGTLRSGSILLRSLQYYAGLEDRTGDDKVGDAFERGAERQMANYDSATASVEAIAAVAAAGFISGGGGRLIVQNMRQLHPTEHTMIFCTSDDPIEGMKDFGYDRAVEIPDLEAFAVALWSEGTIGGSLRIPTRDVIAKPTVDFVTYTDKAIDLLSAEPLPVGPFYKPKKYQSQKEIRIAAPAIDELLHDQIVVQLEKSERLFGETLIGEPAGSPSAVEEEHALLDCLIELRDARRAFDQETRKLERDAFHDPNPNQDPAVRLGGSSSPEYLAFVTARNAAETKVRDLRRSEEAARFKRRTLELTWRARLEAGIRLRDGYSEMATPSNLEWLIDRLLVTDPGSSAAFYTNDTRHFFDPRPARPDAWPDFSSPPPLPKRL